MMPRTRLLSLIVLTCAAGLLTSACIPGMLPTMIGFASISANGKVVPSADATARPAATSASAAAAVQAKTIKIDPTTTSITLVAGQTVELDLTGTWMATLNAEKEPAWVCPEIVSASFVQGDTSGAGLASMFTSKITAEMLGQLSVPMQASQKAAVMGPTCRSAFTRRKVTVTAPSARNPESDGIVLLVSIASGALGTPGVMDAFVVGQSAIVDVNLTPAAVDPTARVIARSTPVLLGGGAYPESRTLWREVDARLSTDGGGGAMTYSWDLNGDGVYGDVSDAPSPTGTLPAGVAIVPNAVLEPIATAGGTATVGVKVTSAAGLSSTATTTLTPLPNQSYDNNYRNWFTLSSATPVAGEALNLAISMTAEFGGTACIDADADGVYEASTTVPFRSPGPATATYATTALAAGPHEVRVAFIPDGGFNRGTCANPSTDPLLSVYRQVYVSTAAAARRASGVRDSGYTARTSFRLADGALLQAGKSSKTNGPLAGSVFGGTYRWSAPARGNGKTRPGALVAFARGAYAAEAPQLGVLGGASGQVGVGRAYMLLRGASPKDLLCLELASNGLDQAARIVGGRGAGAGLRGTVTGVQFQVPFEAIGVVTTGTGSARTTAVGQVKPFTTAGTLVASTGKNRGLPGACRALISRLPAPSPTPAPMPVPVTG